MLELNESLLTPGNLFHKPGNSSVAPNIMRIPPESKLQKLSGIMMNAVETLSRKVKTTIDTANEPTTIYGVALLLPETDVPITTGKSGRMQGASTVSTPAKNEMMRNAILDDLR